MVFHVGNVYDATIIDVKPQSLVCEVRCDEITTVQTNIRDMYYNAKEKRLFIKGDKASVIVTSTNPFRVCLTKEYVRPLLILDIHGVIGDREPFNKNSRTGRKFIKRPYFEEFLALCEEHFEIAAWSCAKKKNIDLDLFEKTKLLFVWSQGESTRCYNPDVDGRGNVKPRFLKELSRVWKKFPCYNKSNTLLLDNDIEKCQVNPLGTCLIVPTFSFASSDRDEDNVLAPSGDLVRHLLAMSAETPVDTSQYMCDRAGSCSMFPSSYSPPTAFSVNGNCAIPNNGVYDNRGGYVRSDRSSRSHGMYSETLEQSYDSGDQYTTFYNRYTGQQWCEGYMYPWDSQHDFRDIEGRDAQYNWRREYRYPCSDRYARDRNTQYSDGYPGWTSRNREGNRDDSTYTMGSNIYSPSARCDWRRDESYGRYEGVSSNTRHAWRCERDGRYESDPRDTRQRWRRDEWRDTNSYWRYSSGQRET
mmetsp:Transcript_9994/g.15088  ORF Transcript_9994/g.15088 Transcript_9994/m.15088 type:complete len:473 (-) Transcript_9994:427-1845(-)